MKLANPNQPTLSPADGSTGFAPTEEVRAKPEMPQFQAAVRSARAAERRYLALSDAHTAAEEAADAFGAGLPDNLEPPACLTVAPKDIVLVIDGDERPVETKPFTFTTVDQIESSDLPTDRKQEMLAAIANWKAEQAAVDEATGWTAEMAKVATADKAMRRAYNDLITELHRLMKVPTAASADIKIKLAWIDKYADFDGDEERWLRDVLKASLRGAATAVPAFDATGWLDAWLRIPGHVFDRFGPAYVEPEAWPEGDHSKPPAGSIMWKSLSKEQKAAVMALARERDPLPDFSNATYTPIENSVTAAHEEAAGDGPEGALIGREAIRDAWVRGRGAQIAAE